MIGKRNSAFEIADGLLPWARQVVLGSPRPVQTSVLAQATVRVRYLQPFEDHALGGGTFALDLAVDRIERVGDRWRVFGQGTTRACNIELEVDDVIAATGFSTPLLDLEELGVRTVAQGRIPAMTPFWESSPGSGIYFAGNTTQGAPGLRKHGVGAASAAVHGFRYNARVMARHLVATHLGPKPACPTVDAPELAPYLLEEATTAPELWAQKAYLARAVYRNGDTEIVPLAAWLDDPGDGAAAVTVEMDASGDVYPAVYSSTEGNVRELLLPPHHLNDFRGPEHEAELRAAL